ncbi:hypothetical protein [Thermomonas sp.]|uniref:hypothetical protein n=1 Tax=Thermomonas sp. TaxID=1971895 RepID=UPI0035AFC1F3
MSWDPFQREVLVELGLVAYQPVTQRTPAMAIPAGESDATMLARVARAAGLAPEALQASAPAIAAACAALAGDAAAKRALWPRLRRLRRERG